ncbi:MAG: hypothetical protein IT326_08070, partial [Anaerolineae bacterium]|nr:hypothetical protein [Anaerolineae bacterium]
MLAPLTLAGPLRRWATTTLDLSSGRGANFDAAAFACLEAEVPCER